MVNIETPVRPSNSLPGYMSKRVKSKMCRFKKKEKKYANDTDSRSLSLFFSLIHMLCSSPEHWLPRAYSLQMKVISLPMLSSQIQSFQSVNLHVLPIIDK